MILQPVCKQKAYIVHLQNMSHNSDNNDWYRPEHAAPEEQNCNFCVAHGCSLFQLYTAIFLFCCSCNDVV